MYTGDDDDRINRFENLLVNTFTCDHNNAIYPIQKDHSLRIFFFFFLLRKPQSFENVIRMYLKYV